MPSKMPYDCKFIWGSREFEDELRRMADRIKKSQGIHLSISMLTYHLADEMKQGKINIQPNAIRYRKKNFVKVGDINVHVQKV